MFWFMLEKFFGFGAKKFETTEEGETGEKTKKEVTSWEVRTESQKTSEIMFR